MVWIRRGRTELLHQVVLALGDCVQVTSPTIGYTFSQGAIRPPIAKQFRVVAIFEAGFDQYDSKLVYTDLYEAQGFYDQGDTVTGVEMKVADIDKAKMIAANIDKMLANGLYHTMDWEELNHGLFTALRIQKISMSLVLGLIIGGCGATPESTAPVHPRLGISNGTTLTVTIVVNGRPVAKAEPEGDARGAAVVNVTGGSVTGAADGPST